MEKYDKVYPFTEKFEEKLPGNKNIKGYLSRYGVSFVFLKNFSERKRTKKQEISNWRWLETINVAPLSVTKLTIRNLELWQAKQIFHRAFWEPSNLDELPVQMAALIFDASVDRGIFYGVQLAQRGFNRLVFYGVRLDEDGEMGPLTKKALRMTNNATCWDAIIAEREKFYDDIVLDKPSQSVFLGDWKERCRDLRRFLETL